MKCKATVLSIITCFSLNFLAFSVHAKGYPRMPSYGSTYGKTHNVRPYIRKDGTFVRGHRAGNPGSGVHCKDSVCY